MRGCVSKNRVCVLLAALLFVQMRMKQFYYTHLLDVPRWTEHK